MDFKLNDFIRLSSGKYNAGNLTAERSGNTNVLKIANNHVRMRMLNSGKFNLAQAIELKEAFVRALQNDGKLDGHELNQIRKELGLDNPSIGVASQNTQALFRPLMREQVRDIVNRYNLKPQDDNNKEAKPASADEVKQRNQVNESLLKKVNSDTNMGIHKCLYASNKNDIQEALSELRKKPNGNTILAKLLLLTSSALASDSHRGGNHLSFDADNQNARTNHVKIGINRADNDTFNIYLNRQDSDVALPPVSKENIRNLHKALTDLLPLDFDKTADQKALLKEVGKLIATPGAAGAADLDDSAIQSIAMTVLNRQPIEYQDGLNAPASEIFRGLSKTDVFEIINDIVNNNIHYTVDDIKDLRDSKATQNAIPGTLGIYRDGIPNMSDVIKNLQD